MRTSLSKVAWLLFGLAVTADATANPDRALHLFMGNTTRAGLTFDDVTSANARAMPTLVNNLYELYANDKWITYFNESGNLFLDGTQFRVLPKGGQKGRLLSQEGRGQLLGEVIEHLEWDKLVKVQYGTGGGRRIIERSALDCSICRMVETGLRTDSASLNTTFYIIPASLRPISQGAEPTWRNVANIWCAQDRTQAWSTYWISHAVPNPAQCEWNAQSAEEASEAVADIFDKLGVRDVNSTPLFIAEDGQRIYLKFPLKPGGLDDKFGAKARPESLGAAHKWLIEGRS
jgi:hypothetical protein